jgi:hypothetical protein
MPLESTAVTEPGEPEPRLLVSLTDPHLAIVFEYAAAVGWPWRKSFLLAVTSHLARSNRCDAEGGDAEVVAACQYALVAYSAAGMAP